MSDPKKPSPKAPAAPGAPSHDAKAQELRGEIQALQQEIKIMEGMLKNRRPELMTSAKGEKDALVLRADKLMTILMGMQQELLRPRDKDEFAYKVEALKTSALGFFKKAAIDEGLWKDLES